MNEKYEMDEARKQGIHSGFDTQGRHHQKSKTGIPRARQKDFFLQKEAVLSLLSDFLVNFTKLCRNIACYDNVSLYISRQKPHLIFFQTHSQNSANFISTSQWNLAMK